VEVSDPPESRALVALGYPLFPLALLALFDRKQSKRVFYAIRTWRGDEVRVPILTNWIGEKLPANI
jgi:hypothetical protein